jgi:hypothetical protein
MKDFKFTIKPNPNTETFKEVSDAVKACDNYCCCEIERNDNTKCMCKNFREMKETGFCHCGRFYKVQEFPIITILCTPDECDRANAIAEDLTQEGFIVLTPMYKLSKDYFLLTDFYNEMQRVKIAKADMVLVLNTCQAAVDFLEEQILWAEDLQKKIVYEFTEEVKENEN